MSNGKRLFSIRGCPVVEAVGELALGEGEAVFLVGPNGSGKTSLLRFIAFGDAPYPINQCSLSIDGNLLINPGGLGLFRRHIQYIPSERMVFPDLTVEENIKLGIMTGGIPRNERDKILGEIYGLFPIFASRRRQLAGTLSGGEQKMLSIARALAARARILLVDEPSAGLAPKAIDTIYSIFRDLRAKGVSLLVAEQSLWPIIRNIDSVDTIYVIHNMRIVNRQSPGDIMGSDIARKYFGLRR